MTTLPIPTRRRASSAPASSTRKASCWADLFKDTSTKEPTATLNRDVHPLAVLITQYNNTNELTTVIPSTTTTEKPKSESEPEFVSESTAPPPLKKPPPSEALQRHMAAIIQEELRTPPTIIPRGRCCVCFTPDADLVFVCQNELTPAAASFPATTCEGALCLDCIKNYIQNIMCDSKYSLPAVRCPGRCFSSIPSASWRGAIHYGDDIGEKKEQQEDEVEEVGSEQKSTPAPPSRSWKDVLLGVKDDEEVKKEEARRKAKVEAKKKKVEEMVKKRKENIEFESLMVSKFESNSSTVLSIRCGACDNTCDMSEVELADDDIACREALVADILSMGGDIVQGGQEMQERMFCQWEGFMQHRVSAVELVETMSQYIDESESRKSDEGDEMTDDRERFFNELVAPLMRDVERRARFLLTVYKKFPKFFVKCCYYQHCFACKVDNWHEGITCEQQQLAELEIEAQFCPECGVPTIRTDGCSDMLCACGSVWEWEGDDCDY